MKGEGNRGEKNNKPISMLRLKRSRKNIVTKNRKIYEKGKFGKGENNKFWL